MFRKKSPTDQPVSVEEAAGQTAATAPQKGDNVFQFKITLQESKPPIWRRIQIRDCTLDRLHEHIQMAMGWANMHLYQFEIGGRRYGNPEFLDDGFDDIECIDSTRTKISQIVPTDGQSFRFVYEYDFGDSWMHEVLFEGCPPAALRRRYPVCLEGARACPPEDCGGPWGYVDYLVAIADPRHKRHKELLKWNGPFDPEAFNARYTTAEMRMLT